jgi:hypothetical protein
MPNENISILEFPALYVCNSGAIYNGVPLIDKFYVKL